MVNYVRLETLILAMFWSGDHSLDPDQLSTLLVLACPRVTRGYKRNIKEGACRRGCQSRRENAKKS